MKNIRGIHYQAGRKNDRIPVIKQLPLPQRVVLPLSSKWGDLSPLVKTGDSVLTGQKIAEHPEGLISPVFASISGTVKAIETWTVHSGVDVLSCIIDSDDKDTFVDHGDEQVAKQDPEDILKSIAEAGIREVDPYTLPLAVRIAQPGIAPQIPSPIYPDPLKPVEFLIINAMDRQPGVSVRRNVIATQEKALLDGIQFLQKVSGAPNTVLAVHKDLTISPNFNQGLIDRNITLKNVPSKYPLGLEPLLVQFITGREVPQPSGDARTVGAVVVDIITVHRVCEAVKKGSPAVETKVQVSAFSQGLDTHVQVREGMLLEDLFSDLSLSGKRFAKVIMGGPFLGQAQYKLNTPITQEIDSIVLQTEDEVSHFSNQPCISCGDCVRFCPMRLLPNQLSRFCEYSMFDAAEKMDLFHCIKCGICAYVCPVKRPMVHLMLFGEQQISALREES